MDKNNLRYYLNKLRDLEGLLDYWSVIDRLMDAKNVLRDCARGDFKIDYKK